MVSFLPKHSRRGHNCRHFKLLGACIGGKLINDRPRHLALMTSWVSRSLAFATFASSTMIIRISHAGRPSPPKIQGCQIDQQIHRWLKDQLQDSIANKRMAWPNYRQSSFP